MPGMDERRLVDPSDHSHSRYSIYSIDIGIGIVYIVRYFIIESMSHYNTLLYHSNLPEARVYNLLP